MGIKKVMGTFCMVLCKLLTNISASKIDMMQGCVEQVEF